MINFYRLSAIILCILISNLSLASDQFSGLSIFINPNPTIDYNDKALDKVLSSCTLNVCKAYKGLIDYSKGIKNPNELIRIKQVFSEIAKDIVPAEYLSAGLEEYDRLLKEDELSGFLYIISSRGLYPEELDPDMHHPKVIPLWVVLKYPKILSYMNDRFSPSILSDHSIYDLKEFQDLESVINRMWHGRFETSSYYQHRGTIYYDLNSRYINLRDFLSFAPGRLNKKLCTVEENLRELKAWSLEGIWNQLVYKEFIKSFDAAVLAVQKYYKQNYGLAKYSAKAKLLMSQYVQERFPIPSTSELSAFKAVSLSDGNIEELKTYTVGFKKKDWSELLHMAILSEFSVETIKWIIKSGANVNHEFMYEMPLMNAVTQPEILKVLLACKANIHAKNPFGKTALFYAVQFGKKESVELLLKAGARVNDALDTLPKMKKKFDCYSSDQCHSEGFYLTENVAGFTPIIYALRYASREVIVLLANHGAKFGKVDYKDFKDWVVSDNISEESLKEILRELKHTKHLV